MLKKVMLAIGLSAVILTGCGDDLANPPPIYLVANGKLLDGFQSSYCWDQGFGNAICVDTAAPYFEDSIPLDISKAIQFQLDIPLPDRVELVISKEVLGESIFSENVPVNRLIEWSPEVTPGEYIIAVHAKWKPGDVSYWFSILLQ